MAQLFASTGGYQPVNTSPSYSTVGALGEASHGDEPSSEEMTVGQAWCLYLSHFLSMWNSRMYEFGVILFIQAAFPGNLTASSINGITETTCVLLFSSALGRWVDRNPRLYTLFLTIAVNRAAIVVSCLLWFSILSSDVPAQKNALFSLVLILGMVEKNSRMTNILSMERDWIPTLASSIPGAQFNLTYLNTMMRRIDIFCKFIAPLAISTFISAIAPVKIAIVVVAMISMFSFVPECWCVRKVYSQSSRLQMPNEDKGVNASSASSAWNERLGSKLWSSIDTHVRSLRYYFKSPVWVPSLGIAVLHASVLTYSATFITYLLNAGFPLGMLTVAKAIGSIFEIGSTFVFLWAVNALSKANVSSELQPMEEDGDAREPEDQNSMLQNAIAWNPNTGVVIVGLWGICGLVLNLIPVIICLFYIDSALPLYTSSSPPSLSKADLVPIIILIAFLSFSFLGRWIYDLSITQLTQTLIPASRRSSFGGTEMAIVSCMSLTHWIAAAIWHSQRDFKWLALGSFGAVGIGAIAYAWWAKIWRGGGVRYYGKSNKEDFSG